ncbi:MAG: class I SAM-dependent methyltransferase [Xanthobacteraceae bacterium]
MNFWQVRSVRLAAMCAAAIVVAGAALAEQKAFEPKVGQSGKDVIWVPTPEALVEKMLDLTKVTAKDIVYDLGSGDGRTVIAAAKRGARAVGIEYNPKMVELSRQNATKAGVTERATFRQADIFQTDFSEATVVTLYLLTSLNAKLRPTILNMKPGTRVASNSFGMGDWQPDQTVSGFEGCQYCTAHYWMVPAKVGGTWKLADGEIVLEQRHQMLSGRVKSGTGVATISAGKMTGNEITFTAGGSQYVGKLNGNALEGVIKSTTIETPWRATRS